METNEKETLSFQKEDIINVSEVLSVAIFAVSWKTCLENKTNKEEKTAKRSAVLKLCYSLDFPGTHANQYFSEKKCSLKSANSHTGSLWNAGDL